MIFKKKLICIFIISTALNALYASENDNSQGIKSMMKKKEIITPEMFIKAFELNSTEKFRIWAEDKVNDKERNQKHFLIPVKFKFSNNGFQLNVFIAGSFSDAIELDIDDSALGVSLKSRLKGQKEEDKIIWLAGYWGNLISNLLFEEDSNSKAIEDDTRLTFSVITLYKNLNDFDSGYIYLKNS